MRRERVAKFLQTAPADQLMWAALACFAIAFCVLVLSLFAAMAVSVWMDVLGVCS